MSFRQLSSCLPFFFFFFLGYRGIVHPPSDDEGTERTWFEPEQRPRKRVPKRSVHGKQSPQGASKAFWRQAVCPWQKAGLRLLSQFWEVLVPELLAVLQEAFEAQHGLWLAISMIQGVSTLLYSSSQKSASKHVHCCTLQHFLASPAALVS